MIDLYTYRTSNGRKVSIMLEEIGLAYDPHVVDITRGEQDGEDFRALNPNGRIPAIIDQDGPDGEPYGLFESGAILMYLADKTGMLLPPADQTGPRYRVIEWLMFQMGGVGPNFGQAFHFLHQTPEDAPDAAIAYGKARYGAEVLRLCKVMDGRLGDSPYLGGNDYSIADIACFPWVALHRWFGIQLAALPHLKGWVETVGARPAVRRGMDIPSRDVL